MSALNDEEMLLYLRVYQHFRDLILSGKLKKNAKLPSVRSCAKQLQVSRTTVENAYQLLTADGYVISKPQSGYYVTDLPEEGRRLLLRQPKPETEKIKQAYGSAGADDAGRGTGRGREINGNNHAIPDSLSGNPVMPERVYDFTSRAVDRESFDFGIWRRYIKSALRKDARMLSYGEPQGEWELRCVLADYAARSRNVHCSPEDIVIGAGIQSLLQILCPLLRPCRTVSFPTPSFRQGIQIFTDYGYEISYRDKNAQIIYVSPSHMNRWGEVMSVKRRLELLRHAAENKSLIIEDDYESEFQYLHQPIPSLQSLSGAQGVVYLGTFSRLLLPSIRLSYMVLPEEISRLYQEKSDCYNQTASKAEQIALCQFIRDGHLEQQIRKQRKLYAAKTRQLYTILQDILKESSQEPGLQLEEGNLCVVLTLSQKTDPGACIREAYARTDDVCQSWKRLAKEQGVLFDSVLRSPDGNLKIVLSSQGMPAEEMEAACRKTADVLNAAILSGLQ